MIGILIHFALSIIAGFFIQITLHEVGHLILGLITGWRFLFIQIHKIVLKYANGKLNLIIVRDKGFKCIMYPKTINTGALLYTMGGCILNLFSAVMGILLMLSVRITPIILLYLWCFTAFGFCLFLMNGRANIKRICNDKACFDFLKADYQTRLCHNAQLLVAKHLINGLTYKEIGKENISLCKNTAKNDIEAYQVILEYYYYLDEGNYKEAGKALSKIKNTENFSSEIIGIIHLEQIYEKLISFFNQHDTMRNDISFCDIQGLHKQGDVQIYRVLVTADAYRQFKTGNVDTALDILNRAIEKMQKSNYVYDGEKIFCIRQLTILGTIIKNVGCGNNIQNYNISA